VFVYGPEAPREIVQIPVAGIHAVVERLVFEKVALERIVIERAIHRRHSICFHRGGKSKKPSEALSIKWLQGRQAEDHDF
jgi:hypothetical protein